MSNDRTPVHPNRTGLIYVGHPQEGMTVTVYPDRVVVEDKRERAICKALLQHALDLIEEAEDNGE